MTLQVIFDHVRSIDIAHKSSESYNTASTSPGYFDSPSSRRISAIETKHAELQLKNLIIIIKINASRVQFHGRRKSAVTAETTSMQSFNAWLSEVSVTVVEIMAIFRNNADLTISNLNA